METSGYYIKFFWLLVLQFSVSSHAQEVTTQGQQIISTPTPTTILATTDTAPPQVFPEEPVNGKQIISSKTIVSRPIQLNSSNENLNDTENGNPETEGASTSKPEDNTSLDDRITSIVYFEEGMRNLSRVKINGSETEDLLKFPNLLRQSLDDIPDVSPNVSSNTMTLDTETELIEDGQDIEDIIRNVSWTESSQGPGVPLIQGQLAAILAAVFVSISVIGYVSLLSWRRYLENRYGNRDLLVDHEEINDIDDLRHFTI